MPKILIAVDGTGPWLDSAYQKEMGQSFVSQICNRSRISLRFYHRGPSVTGIESGLIGLQGLAHYLAALHTQGSGKPIEIYMTGYSRGAMICVYIANRIADFNRLNRLTQPIVNRVKESFGFAGDKPADIRIKKMLLFDTVCSDATMYGPGIRRIPRIVEHVDHFICEDVPEHFQQSRWYFGRIHLEAESTTGTKIVPHPYHCTHSAIGGLPGQGDHQVPANKADLVAAGMTGASKVMRLGPAAALAAGATAAGLRGWEAVRSGVTLKQDRDIYRSVLRKVRACLGGFDVAWLEPFHPPTGTG